MCSKLEYYGFDMGSVTLLRSYLNNRTQRIVIGEQCSQSLHLTSGVPQGSILGPLLFIIYTTELLNSISRGKVVAYADDMQLHFGFKPTDIVHVSNLINDTLNNVVTLSREHNLKLNPKKSKLICFGSRLGKIYVKANLNVFIDNQMIPFVNFANNLGVIVDEDLRFSEHLKHLNKKAYSALKLIYSNRHILGYDLKRLLCETLVLSHYQYCDFIYGPCLYTRDKKRIQKVQNSCCRLIYNLKKYDHISHKIKECNWLNMDNRRLHHLGNFVHKLLNVSDPPLCLKCKFVSRSHIHSVNVRNKDRFTMPQHRNVIFRRGFTYNAINLYNWLPIEFKKFNINKFKYKFRHFLFSRQ